MTALSGSWPDSGGRKIRIIGLGDKLKGVKIFSFTP